MPSNAYQYFCSSSLKNVTQLMELHSSNYSGPGKKSAGFLTSSGVLLLCSAWESYVEDVVKEASQRFTEREGGISLASMMPKRSQELLRRHVEKDLSKLIQLADNWKPVFDNAVDERIRRANGPRFKEVRSLIFDVIGDNGLSQSWTENECDVVDELIDTRNKIAHGDRDQKYVRKVKVEDFIETIQSVARKTDDWICEELRDLKIGAWHKVRAA